MDLSTLLGSFARGDGDRLALERDLLERAATEPETFEPEIGRLVDLLSGEPVRSRAGAAVLGRLAAHDQSLLEPHRSTLVDSLTGDDGKTREYVTDALTHLARTTTMPVDRLLALLADGAPGTQRSAAVVLGVVAAERPDRLPEDRIVSLTNDDDEVARGCAVYVFAVLAGEGMTDQLPPTEFSFVTATRDIRAAGVDQFVVPTLLSEAITVIADHEIDVGRCYDASIARTSEGTQLRLCVDHPDAVAASLGGPADEGVTGKLRSLLGLEDLQIHLTEADAATEPDTQESPTDGDSGGSGTPPAEFESDANDASDRDRDGQSTPPTSPAARAFAEECGAVESADAIDASGPVHRYDGTLTDGTEAGLFVLAPEYAGDEVATTAFERASRQWSGISHNDHVATVFDSDDEPRPWIAFDAGDGTLARRHHEYGAEARLQILEHTIDGLNTGVLYNVAHGAVAPETVAVEGGTSAPTAAVADWGIERAVRDTLDERRVTGYTAPEQLDGGASPTTDVYRVGALGYALLTETEPYSETADRRAAIGDPKRTLSEEASGLSPAVAEVLARATASDPADRYDSLTALRDALRGARH